jgi:uncharacterized protein (TIGR02646 family)
MRPVERGSHPIDPVTKVPLSFKNYRDSKSYLVKNIGSYCSYCEKKVAQLLDVEHILPKAHYQQLESTWHNFLLSCKVCNSIKGYSRIRRKDYYWSDVDNTFHIFEYHLTGEVKINPLLSSVDRQIAENTLNLVGLDRKPGHPRYKTGSADWRWSERLEATQVAQESFADLQKNNTPEMRNQIIRNAQGRGFWSIWMTVFREDTDMINRLINAFPGTCKSCFDVDGRTISRPKGRI